MIGGQTSTLHPSQDVRIIHALKKEDVDCGKMLNLMISTTRIFKRFISLLFDNLVKYNEQTVVLLVRDFLDFTRNSETQTFASWLQSDRMQDYTKQWVSLVCLKH